MLSHPFFSQQQLREQQVDHHQQPQHYLDDFAYLSSSLPLPSQHQHQQPQQQHMQTPTFGSDFLTDSYDPHLFDDICVMEPMTSSSLPLDEHDNWFRFPSSSQTEEEDGGEGDGDIGMPNVNMDPSSFYHHPEGMPTIDEVTVSTNASMPPPPPLSQSFSPQSDLSMTSPQAQQQHQQHPPNMTGINNNLLMTPSYKGHRRRRSSSLPSIFYSAKKQMVEQHHHPHPHAHTHHQQQQPSFVPPLFNATRAVNATTDTIYSPQQSIHDFKPQPSPPQAMVLPLEAIQQQQQPLLQQQQLARPQQQSTKPLPIQIQRNPVSNPRNAAPIALDQQQLDDKLRQVNFNDVTVAELKDLLRERNLSVAGRKAELTNRLYNELQRVLSSAVPGIVQPQMPIINTAAPPSPEPSQTSASPLSQHSHQKSPPPPIQQLTHRLSDLGFNQQSNVTFPNNSYQQQQQSNSTLIPMSLPQQQLPSRPPPPPPPPPQQQQQGDNTTMSQFYNF